MSERSRESTLSPVVLPDRLGRYRIIRPLGKGGMGSVYLARDENLDRDVAVKVCHLADKPMALERFRREAKAAAGLSHPHLCPVYDFDVRDGIAYLTMAFVDGPTLNAWVAQRGGIRQCDVALLVAKLALAMQEAHDAGIIHRDLKPGNIIINRKGEPVILDFGLARRTEDVSTRLTQVGAVLGTPSYMAPEQAEGDPKRIGPATDIYGLGVILYELLTGELPFQGPTLSVLSQVLRTPPEPPRKRNPAIDSALNAICLTALAKKPEERYPSMKEFARALTQAARTLPQSAIIAPVMQSLAPTDAGVPQASTPPPLPQFPLIHMPRRRRPRRWSVSILLGTVLLSLLIVAVWIGVHFRQERSPDTVDNTQRTASDKRSVQKAKHPSLVDPVKEQIPSKTADPGKPKGPPHEIENRFGMKLVWIEPGTFDMGSPVSEPSRELDELQHRVTLTRGFYLGATLVTQRQWREVMSAGENPSLVRGDELPVDSVDWQLAKEFCQQLRAKTGKIYRLPTEAEWEYACRAGTRTPFWCGETITTVDANYDGNFPYRNSSVIGINRGRSTPVMTFKPNPWGLYDMHGNLWQWCEDWFGDYPKTAITDPSGPLNGEGRVLRGGSWISKARDCRAAYRLRNTPSYRTLTVGFRVVQNPD